MKPYITISNNSARDGETLIVMLPDRTMHLNPGECVAIGEDAISKVELDFKRQELEYPEEAQFFVDGSLGHQVVPISKIVWEIGEVMKYGGKLVREIPIERVVEKRTGKHITERGGVEETKKPIVSFSPIHKSGGGSVCHVYIDGISKHTLECVATVSGGVVWRVRHPSGDQNKPHEFSHFHSPSLTDLQEQMNDWYEKTANPNRGK